MADSTGCQFGPLGLRCGQERLQGLAPAVEEPRDALQEGLADHRLEFAARRKLPAGDPVPPNVPVAVNRCLVPSEIDGFVGVTARDTRLAAPVPLKETFCGLVFALSVMVSVPVLVPVVVGAKVTLIAQLAPWVVRATQVLLLTA